MGGGCGWIFSKDDVKQRVHGGVLGVANHQGNKCKSKPRCRLMSLGVAVIKTAVPGLFYVSTDTL